MRIRYDVPVRLSSSISVVRRTKYQARNRYHVPVRPRFVNLEPVVFPATNRGDSLTVTRQESQNSYDVPVRREVEPKSNRLPVGVVRRFVSPLRGRTANRTGRSEPALTNHTSCRVVGGAS